MTDLEFEAQKLTKRLEWLHAKLIARYKENKNAADSKNIRKTLSKLLNHNYKLERMATSTAETNSAQATAFGFMKGIEAAGLEVPPIIQINVMCGRVDRLFAEVE